MKWSSRSAEQPGSLLEDKRVISTVRKILNGCDGIRNEICFIFRSVFWSELVCSFVAIQRTVLFLSNTQLLKNLEHWSLVAVFRNPICRLESWCANGHLKIWTISPCADVRQHCILSNHSWIKNIEDEHQTNTLYIFRIKLLKVMNQTRREHQSEHGFALDNSCTDF